MYIKQAELQYKRLSHSRRDFMVALIVGYLALSLILCFVSVSLLENLPLLFRYFCQQKLLDMKLLSDSETAKKCH